MNSSTSVEETLYRYAHSYDAGNVKGAVDLFLPDGVMSVSTWSESVRGHAALSEFFGRARAARTEAGTQPRHLVTNVVVELSADGQSANSQAYMTLILVGTDTNRIDCTGVYRDHLMLTADGWKFSERHLAFDAV